jgi:DNA adenine methylase
MPETLNGYVERMEIVASRLHRVTLENKDALELIGDFAPHSSVCMYVDPPYLGETRHVGYAVEMLHDDAHTALADVLNDCKGTVVLSGYDSPLYGELFDGWHRMDVRGATTLSGDTDRVEVLWSNRPLGEPDLFGGVA